MRLHRLSTWKKGRKVYSIQNHSFYTSRDIIFYEDIYPYNQESDTTNVSVINAT